MRLLPCSGGKGVGVLANPGHPVGYVMFRIGLLKSDKSRGRGQTKLGLLVLQTGDWMQS